MVSEGAQKRSAAQAPSLRSPWRRRAAWPRRPVARAVDRRTGSVPIGAVTH